MAVLSGIIPVFLLIGLGALARRLGWANEIFVRDLNRIIYWFAIPALLLQLLGKAQLDTAFSGQMIAVCLAATGAAGAAGLAYAVLRREPAARLGVIVQATVRGNLVYMGFPVIYAAAGEEALAVAAVTAAILIPFQNILAVAALVGAEGHSGFSAFKAIILNPVVLGVAGGLLSSLMAWEPWVWLDSFLHLLGNIAMPGALLALGAQMGARTLRESTEAVAVSTFLKLAAVPALGIVLMHFLQIDGTPRLVGILLLATPTAVASTAVAQEMGGDLDLAGACVMATSLASFPTYLIWGMMCQ
ncbi:MAG: AEC family transporter [Thermoanaerobaculales bacterium]|nr:AEC family transporter [Thermoanaerobaculales bacterium]